MGGGSPANGLVRWLGTLYNRGAIGGFSDARLVERFASRDGADRDDAFSVLVHRHGPMVQRVCRRMLSDPADADDAFQAVFLVLARKAGSLRRAADLKSWLYGVAVRTSLEARKRRARIRAREGAPLNEDDAPEAIARGAAFEPLALLDEELNKLPNRLREPLLLCELEGISRQEAARRLGLPEGTLSSRLARGRSLLRDRLARRGVAVGALGTLFPPPAKAAATAADASLRLALKYAARDAGAGTVPAAVASLAEGALQMIHAAKLKTILLASSTLAAVGLAVGLLAGRAAPPDEPPPKAVAQAAEPAAKAAPLEARGVVVDEAGNPVAGVEVRFRPFEPGELTAVTGADGAFAFPAPEGNLDGLAVVVAAGDGRSGAIQYGYNMTWDQAREPVRIVVKPSREIAVRVVDSNNAPVPGAAVEVLGYFYTVGEATTGADGGATVRVPANVRVCYVLAQKGGAGLDYAEFGEFDRTRHLSGVPVADVPDSLTLTLEPPRAARVQTVDLDGKPMAGVELRVASEIKKAGRRGGPSYFGFQNVAKSDADGVATFDWLPPPVKNSMYLVVPLDPQFDQRHPAAIMTGAPEPIVYRLARKEKIRGRVIAADGSPAKYQLVYAEGASLNVSTARTGEDGTYEMAVSPFEAYAVTIGGREWTAAARLDVVVVPGKPVDGVDFQLAKPTFLTGTVTTGDDNHPAAGKYVQLNQLGRFSPEDPRVTDDGFRRQVRQVRREFIAATDAEGRYKIRLGPGTYNVVGPTRVVNDVITVAEEGEIVHDFILPPPPKVPVSGLVIAAADEKPVAGARVDVVSWHNQAPPLTVTTDAEGRFQAERAIDTTFLCVWSPDGSLGGMVLIGEKDSGAIIKLSPTATATGQLLDQKGQPAANQDLEWGRSEYLNEEQRFVMVPIGFSKNVVTDDQGRFTLPALVVGAQYAIHAKNDPLQVINGYARPQNPGPMDLGTIKMGDTQPR